MAQPALRPSFSLDDAMNDPILGKSSGSVETGSGEITGKPKEPVEPTAESSIAASKEEFKTKTDPLFERISSNRDEMAKLELPELQEIPEAPKAHDRDPLQAFGSLASTMAIFGSLLTRAPLVNALNAASGVMEAWKGQDAAAAAKEFDLWKVNTANAITLQKWQQDHYENAIKKLDTDTDGALKEIQILATVYKDDVMSELARTKQINEILRIKNQRDGISDDLMRKAILLEKYQAYQTAVSEKTTELGRPLNAAETGELQGRYLSSGEFKPEMEYKDVLPAIDAGIAGDWSAAQAMVGRTAKAKAEFAGFMKQRMDERKIPENERGIMLANAKAAFEGEKAAMRNLATLQARFATFKGTAESIADEVSRTSKGFERFGNLPLNKAYARISKELGDTTVTVFETALNTFAAEYARALQQTGVTTDSMREHVREMFSRDLTHAQIIANVAQAKREMGLISKNFANVKGLITGLWASTTPAVTPTFGEVPSDEELKNNPITPENVMAPPKKAEMAPGASKEADPGSVPTEPSGTVITQPATGKGAAPAALAPPKDQSMMRDKQGYQYGDRVLYWDAATKKLYPKPRP